MRTSCDVVLRWMPQNTFDYNSTLVQVMGWYRQAITDYLSQCWPSSISPYSVTWPQWVTLTWHILFKSFCRMLWIWKKNDLLTTSIHPSIWGHGDKYFKSTHFLYEDVTAFSNGITIIQYMVIAGATLQLLAVFMKSTGTWSSNDLQR